MTSLSANAPQRRLYFSSEVRGDIRLQLGMAHYSYGIVAQRFAQMLERDGIAVVAVPMPEKLKRRSDFSAERDDRRPVHIAFRSPENLRPLPAAYNVCHFAWEFDTLKDTELTTKPITSNQRHMLSLMDEIWVPARFTREVLARHGLPRVHVVPTPVCGTCLPERLSHPDILQSIGLVATSPLLMSSTIGDRQNAQLDRSAMSALMDHLPSGDAARQAKIFLTVCNPGDLRKNLLSVIEGFLMATRKHQRDLLIVKLAVPAGRIGADDECLHRHLGPRYHGPVAVNHPRVLFISDYLADAEMSALYSLADFYICGSHCEGHNLPLLEAMAHGAVAVSTRNTAMADYIDENDAVVIAERRIDGLLPGMAGEHSGMTPTLSVADRFDIARAVVTAAAMTPAAHAAMAQRGRDVAFSQYGVAAVAQLVHDRLGEIDTRQEHRSDV